MVYVTKYPIIHQGTHSYIDTVTFSTVTVGAATNTGSITATNVGEYLSVPVTIYANKGSAVLTYAHTYTIPPFVLATIGLEARVSSSNISSVVATVMDRSLTDANIYVSYSTQATGSTLTAFCNVVPARTY